MKTTHIVIALAALLGACTGSTVPCSERPTDPLCQDDSGPPVDMGTDANADAHVLCNGMCSGATPHCLVSGTSETCVGCTAEGDCSGSTPHCDTMGSHTCVACVDSMQCTAADAAFCDPSHTCQPCTISTQCAHLTATPVCVTTGAMMGTCAQCNTNADCTGTNTGCDTSTHTCVSYTPASANLCEACVADSQCQSGQLCVPMTYRDPTMTGAMPEAAGSYCLWRLDASGMGPHGSCLNTIPYSNAIDTTSADGIATMVCSLTVSTCAAQADFRNRDCMTLDMTGDALCGVRGLHDGVCRMRDATHNQCTVFCVSDDDCPSGLRCDTGSPRVCRFN